MMEDIKSGKDGVSKKQGRDAGTVVLLPMGISWQMGD